MPKYQVETPDGKVFEVETPEIDPSKASAAKQAQQFESKISGKEKALGFLEEAAPIITGAAGQAYAGLPGLATGSLVGNLGAQAIRRGPQNINVPEAVIDSLINTVLDKPIAGASTYLGNLIPNLSQLSGAAKSGGIVNALKAKLLNKISPTAEMTERAATIAANPEIPYTASAATGSRMQKLIESVATPIKSRDIAREQQVAAGDKFRELITDFSGVTGIQSQPTVAARLKSNVESGLNTIKSLTQRNIEDLHKIIDPAVLTYKRNYATKSTAKPVLQDIEVHSPIAPNESYTLAKQMLDKIKSMYGVKSNIDPVSVVAAEQKPLVSTLQSIVQAGEIKDGKLVQVHPLDFETAWELKKFAGDRGNWGTFKSFTEKQWNDLNRALNRDIQSGLASIDPTGKANSLYDVANKLTQRKYQLYGRQDAPVANKLIETAKAGTQQLQDILKDPVTLRKTLEATKSPTQARRDLMGEWLTDIYQKSLKYHPETNSYYFDVQTPLAALGDRNNKEVLNQLLAGKSPRSRAYIEDFFKGLALSEPSLPMTAVTAVGIRMGSAAIGLAPGLAQWAVTGDLPSAARTALATFGVGIAFNQFSKRILLNPTVARMAAQLPTLPAASQKAKHFSKAIMVALKGAQVSLLTPDGKQMGTGTVMGDGTVKPDSFGLQQ